MPNHYRNQMLIRMSTEEKAHFHAAADRQGMTFAKWARKHLHAAAKREARADAAKVKSAE